MVRKQYYGSDFECKIVVQAYIFAKKIRCAALPQKQVLFVSFSQNLNRNFRDLRSFQNSLFLFYSLTVDLNCRSIYSLTVDSENRKKL